MSTWQNMMRMFSIVKQEAGKSIISFITYYCVLLYYALYEWYVSKSNEDFVNKLLDRIPEFSTVQSNLMVTVFVLLGLFCLHTILVHGIKSIVVRLRNFIFGQSGVSDSIKSSNQGRLESFLSLKWIRVVWTRRSRHLVSCTIDVFFNFFMIGMSVLGVLYTVLQLCDSSFSGYDIVPVVMLLCLIMSISLRVLDEWQKES